MFYRSKIIGPFKSKSIKKGVIPLSRNSYRIRAMHGITKIAPFWMMIDNGDSAIKITAENYCFLNNESRALINQMRTKQYDLINLMKKMYVLTEFPNNLYEISTKKLNI